MTAGSLKENILKKLDEIIGAHTLSFETCTTETFQYTKGTVRGFKDARKVIVNVFKDYMTEEEI